MPKQFPGFLLPAFLIFSCAPQVYFLPAACLETGQAPYGESAFLRIKSAPPFASLQVNGVFRGDAPTNGYLAVQAGIVHIEVSHRMGGLLDTTLVLDPGERREIVLRLLGEENP